MHISEKLKVKEKNKLPDEKEINGAARGIAKIWSQYK